MGVNPEFLFGQMQIETYSGFNCYEYESKISFKTYKNQYFFDSYKELNNISLHN